MNILYCIRGKEIDKVFLFIEGFFVELFLNEVVLVFNVVVVVVFEVIVVMCEFIYVIVKGNMFFMLFCGCYVLFFL